VHLNVPLRKPLEPVAPSTADERSAAAEAARLRTLPIAADVPSVRVSDNAVARVAAAIAATTRGVLLATAGPASRRGARDAAFTLATRAGWPVLAEAGSQLKFAPRESGVVIDHAGLAASADLAPEVIVQLGGEPVAMSWGALASGARRFIIAEHGWPDGDSTAEAVLIGDVADTLARIAAALPTPRLPSAYARAWRDADRAVADRVAAALAQHAASQPGLAAEHAMVGAAIAAVPEGAQLVLGNSLPVRVADEIAGGGRDLTVLTQRGAAGIDGLIAGAAGAAARGVVTVLVLGDVSFAHDVGALACARGLPLAIVVIDNGGGRIFDQLPVVSSDLPDGAFERLWRTPTALDPVAAARAFGIDAALVRDPNEIAAAIGRASPIIIHAPVAPESAATIRKRSHV
jgi:2-succinyl-5-enolpyruvyl-6-hydroxy-3-cyclohexene-1-carboxylate synthase